MWHEKGVPYRGPWWMGEVIDGWQDINGQDRHGNYHYGFAKVVVQMEDDEVPSPNLMATARLIVRAPELLELVKNLTSGNDSPEDYWAQARAIIDMIEGMP